VRYVIPEKNRSRDVRRQQAAQARIQGLMSPPRQDEAHYSDSSNDSTDAAPTAPDPAPDLSARFINKLGGLLLDDVDDELEAEAQLAHLVDRVSSPAPRSAPLLRSSP
jgi:hypothetical protein